MKRETDKTGDSRKPDAALDKIASAISYSLIPPVIATMVFTVLILVFQHGNTVNTVLVWLVSISCAGGFQVLYILRLRRMQKVSAYDVPQRLQRTRPYILSSLTSFAGLVLLLLLDASIYVWALMWCFSANTLILSIINRFWKISAHVMGLTGPAMFLLPVTGLSLLLGLPVLFALAWARVRLGAHTITQVIAGALAGILLTLLQLLVISAYGISTAGIIW